jgi:hypothetical protein
VYLNQQFSVVYDDPADGKDAYYCNTKKLTISVNDMEGQVQGTMQVEQETGDAFAITSSLEEVVIEQCDTTNVNKYHVRVEVLLEQLGTTDFSATVGGTSSSVYQFYNTTLASDRILQWRTACQDICSAGNLPATWSDPNNLVAAVEHTKLGVGVSVDVSANVKVIGSPCSQEEVIDIQAPTLELYKQEANAAAGSCDADVVGASVVPGEKICAIFKTPLSLEDSHIKITSEELLKKMGSEYIPDPSSRTVLTGFIGQEIAKDDERTGDFDTDTNDAGAEFKLVVDYEQVNPSRRLRAVYVFGAGDDHVEATMKVLPAVQVQDELEAGDENVAWNHETEGLNATERAEQIAENTAKNAETGVTMGWIALGIFLLVCLIGGTMAYKNRGGSSKGTLSGNPIRAVDNTGNSTFRRGYTKVRRSERFSTPKF